MKTYNLTEYGISLLEWHEARNQRQVGYKPSSSNQSVAVARNLVLSHI